MAKDKVRKHDDGKTLVIDYRQVGATGLRRFSGFIYEEFLKELIGWRAYQTYYEMGQNDPTVGAILAAIDRLTRAVSWRAEPASEQPFDREASDFLWTCINDMDATWIDTICEFMTMCQYGYTVNEIVYKRRCGDGFDPTMRSKYADGRIGWRGFPIRSQDTIYRWQFDDHGGIQGVEQLAPPHYYHVTVPVEKFLLFRTTIHKNNPEGRSILRNAYRPWYMKKNIENIEAIGIERDLAGLPVIYAPAEIFSENASQAEKALLSTLKTMVTNIRRDEQEGVLMPQAYDPNGKELYKLQLLSTGGQRQFNTTEVINRYDQRIAMTALADFLLIGHSQVGSLALAQTKTQLFVKSLKAYLDIIESIINDYAIPRLFNLNDFQISDYPKLRHGDCETVDLEGLGKFIQSLTASGMPLWPNPDLEKHIFKQANWPEPVDPMSMATEEQVEPNHREQPEKIVEVPGLPIQTPTGLAQPADTTPVNNKPPVTPTFTNESGNTERTGMTSRMATPEQFYNPRKW